MTLPDCNDTDAAMASLMSLHALPQRWQGRPAFNMLFVGLTSGQALTTVVRVWQRDYERCRALHCVVILTDPPTLEAMAPSIAAMLDAPPSVDAVGAVVHALLAHQPGATTNVHRLDFDEGSITLQLVIGDVRSALRALVGEFDAITLEGALNGTGTAPWDRSHFDALARLSSHDASVVGTLADPTIERGLLRAGFARLGSIAQHWAVRRVPRGPVYDRLARLGPAIAPRHVAIVGAGLAGAHVARALARRGVRCTVLDRHAAPACEASGGKAGIFHGTVHVGDGVHARLFRASALHAAVAHGHAIEAGVPGRIDGLLRLSDTPLEALRAIEAQAALPPAWARVLDAVQATHALGWNSSRHGWLFAQGGWIDPHALVHWLLDHPAITFVHQAEVQTLTRDDHGWRLMDSQNRVVAHADAVVLANAVDAARLWPHASWPCRRSLGQSTRVPPRHPGLQAPRMPISGGGFAITLHDGSVVCGASSHHELVPIPGQATDPARHRRDTHDNVDKLNRLTGSRVDTSTATGLTHHIAWRALSPDRLPSVGAVPAREHGSITDNVRHVARERGLYVLAALGSRGLTLAPLMAEVVVASMLREPVPLPVALLNAVDAARHATRGRCTARAFDEASDSATAKESDTPRPP